MSQSNISAPLKVTPMVRSVSQDISIIGVIPKPKNSLSDNSLETQTYKSSLRHALKKDSPSSLPEDDVCSTDSSVLDETDGKKKKRKLFTFTKKNKKEW